MNWWLHLCFSPCQDGLQLWLICSPFKRTVTYWLNWDNPFFKCFILAPFIFNNNKIFWNILIIYSSILKASLLSHYFLLKVSNYFRNMTSPTTAFQTKEEASKADFEQTHFSKFIERLNTEMRGAGMPSWYHKVPGAVIMCGLYVLFLFFWGLREYLYKCTTLIKYLLSFPVPYTTSLLHVY